MKLILAKPRGFCAGVERAVKIVELALQKYQSPIYALHEIVHNRSIVAELHDKGVIFVDNLSEIPVGSTVIFSAHGVSKQTEEQAVHMKLNVIDATCPLVKKVHLQVQNNEMNGKTTILIGHKDHIEVKGTMGRAESSKIFVVQNAEDVSKLPVKHGEKTGYVTQTTLNIDDVRDVITALHNRFDNLDESRPDSICYATRNRQNAAKKLAESANLILVIGGRNSSNSNRLLELILRSGVRAFLINDEHDINVEWFKDVKITGITAGASTPEKVIQSVLSFLKAHFDITNIAEDEIIKEYVKFQLPHSLVL